MMVHDGIATTSVLKSYETSPRQHRRDRVAAHQRYMNEWARCSFLSQRKPISYTERSYDYCSPHMAWLAERKKYEFNTTITITDVYKRQSPSDLLSHYQVPTEKRRDSLRWDVRVRSEATRNLTI